MAVEQHERKLAELILYVSEKYANDPSFGQVKLNKAIFFPDFNAYATWGNTITGALYQHQPEGPTVLRMLPLQESLKSEGALAIQTVSFHGHLQKRTVNLRPPDLTKFTGREIALIDAWIEKLRPFTAKEVSRLSHETAGWNLTSNGQTIDPKTVFLAWREPNAAEVKRGQALAAQHGLLV